MTKLPPEISNNIGNENSYKNDFFDDLYKKIDAKKNDKVLLKKAIIHAAQKYLGSMSDYQRQLSTHEVKAELKKVMSYFDKAAEGLIKVYAAGHYGSEITKNLCQVIDEKYPSLKGISSTLIRQEDLFTIVSPLKSLDLLNSMHDAVELFLEDSSFKKIRSNRSDALYWWVIIVSSTLEEILGRKLEQSRYYKENEGSKYVSKKNINDSDLLLFIIKPLDPTVTVSQMETALKETREDRNNPPWENLE